MNMSTQTAVIVLVVAMVIGVAGWVWLKPTAQGTSLTGDTQLSQNDSGLIAAVHYSCDADKAIAASYYDASVVLILSDGRDMTLPQTISADGMRYANADESFIFWSKGEGAFVDEGGAQTYSNCVVTD